MLVAELYSTVSVNTKIKSAEMFTLGVHFVNIRQS